MKYYKVLLERAREDKVGGKSGSTLGFGGSNDFALVGEPRGEVLRLLQDRGDVVIDVTTHQYDNSNMTLSGECPRTVKAVIVIRPHQHSFFFPKPPAAPERGDRD